MDKTEIQTPSRQEYKRKHQKRGKVENKNKRLYNHSIKFKASTKPKTRDFEGTNNG